MQNQNNWYRNDNCSFEGNIIANVTSQFGLQQVIKEPTHILDNSYSCIDAIFTFLANLLIQSVVQLSLHSNFHNQLIYQKFNLQTFCFALILICMRKDITKMQKRSLSDIALQCLPWKKLFQTLVLMKKLVILNNTFLSIPNNFILHYAIVCNDRDPTCFNERKNDSTQIFPSKW